MFNDFDVVLNKLSVEANVPIEALYVSGGSVLDKMLGYDFYDIDVFINCSDANKENVKNFAVDTFNIEHCDVDLVYINTSFDEKINTFDFPIKRSYYNAGILKVVDNLDNLLRDPLKMYPNRDISLFRYLKTVKKYDFTPDLKLIYILRNYLVWKMLNRRRIYIPDKYLENWKEFKTSVTDKDYANVDKDLAVLANEILVHNKNVNSSNLKDFTAYYNLINIDN